MNSFSAIGHPDKSSRKRHRIAVSVICVIHCVNNGLCGGRSIVDIDIKTGIVGIINHVCAVLPINQIATWTVIKNPDKIPAGIDSTLVRGNFDGVTWTCEQGNAGGHGRFSAKGQSIKGCVHAGFTTVLGRNLVELGLAKYKGLCVDLSSRLFRCERKGISAIHGSVDGLNDILDSSFATGVYRNRKLLSAVIIINSCLSCLIFSKVVTLHQENIVTIKSRPALISYNGDFLVGIRVNNRSSRSRYHSNITALVCNIYKPAATGS